METVLLGLISPIITIVCICIGYIIKNIVPNQAINQYIPLIAGVLGVIAAVWSMGAFSLDVVAMGLVSGLASTGLYETFRNVLSNIKIPLGDNKEDNDVLQS